MSFGRKYEKWNCKILSNFKCVQLFRKVFPLSYKVKFNLLLINMLQMDYLYSDNCTGNYGNKVKYCKKG